MVSLFKVENVRKSENGDFINAELRGLSDDTKPIKFDNKKIDNGSTFIEIDTGKLFFYDLESETWKEI